jgi:acetylornithine deacetylase/succinyl-diaminopimelate desuccinylase-like protein
MTKIDSKNPVLFFESEWPKLIETLEGWIKIPSVSFDGFPVEEIERSAQSVAEVFRQSGLENVEILRLKQNPKNAGAFPAVYGDWLKAKDKNAPTLLLYAHHDVQPPGRMEKWTSDPFVPKKIQGPGGERLQGRGSADDKAGILVHLAAIRAYLKTAGELPVNVKVFIEGEEEIGSTHLADFLSEYREKLQADVLVLTDTSNFDCGIPALTIGLRGLVALEVEVSALKNSVHSGMWGGPIPDPVQGLAKMLSQLTDDETGRIAIPEIMAMIPEPDSDTLKELKALPYQESRFREQVGLLEGVKILPQGPSPIGQIWAYPSLTVTAIQASSRAQPGNIINDGAWAKVTVRVVEGMAPLKVQSALRKFLESKVPWGLKCEVTPEGASMGWSTKPVGPAFQAARVALKKGYGVEPMAMGCGGSIPFVRPFAEALGGAPALLVGVEDPFTQAHGENESVLLSDLKKACLSQIFLFEELANLRDK